MYTICLQRDQIRELPRPDRAKVWQLSQGLPFGESGEPTTTADLDGAPARVISHHVSRKSPVFKTKVLTHHMFPQSNVTGQPKIRRDRLNTLGQG